MTPHHQLFLLNRRKFHQITLANSGVLVHIWCIRVDGLGPDGLWVFPTPFPFLLFSYPTKIRSITS